MFSPRTISTITEQLRKAQGRVSDTEQQLESARADVAEWSELLRMVEQQLPASGPADQLVASQQQRGPGWCACGLPGLPGMHHSRDNCGSPTTLPGPDPHGPEGRAPFEPYVPSADREQT